MKRQHSSNLFGLIIIIIGAYLLAYNLNLPIISKIGLGEIISISWPLLLVAWGLEALGKKNFVAGTIVTVLGLHFLTGNLSNYFPVLDKFSQFAWPLAIISVGVFVMLAPPKAKKGVSERDFSAPYEKKSKSAQSEFSPNTQPASIVTKPHYTVKTYPTNNSIPVIRTATTVQIDSIESDTITPPLEVESTQEIDSPIENTTDDGFSTEKSGEKVSAQTISNEETFVKETPPRPIRPARQRSYNTSFNSRKLIFSEQDFQEGDNQLDLSVLFGDVAIILPTTISVSFVGTVTLGDVHFFGRRYDGISQTVKDEHQPPHTTEKHLVIQASVMLGDLRIKSS